MDELEELEKTTSIISLTNTISNTIHYFIHKYTKNPLLIKDRFLINTLSYKLCKIIIKYDHDYNYGNLILYTLLIFNHKNILNFVLWGHSIWE